MLKLEPRLHSLIYPSGEPGGGKSENVDVVIVLDDGSRFAATFFTLENVAELLERYRSSGECANGLYLWAADMILVQSLTPEVVRESVLDLLRSGELAGACTQIRGPDVA